MMEFHSTIYDVAQDAHQVASAHKTDREQFEPTCTIDNLPDKCILHAFSFLHQRELGKLARVCKKWRLLAYNNQLWKVVSLRPEYNGLYVNSFENLMALINVRFGATLRYIELPCELVTPPILHELSNKCPSLKFMTIDFSNAMQLHDFNDLNSFPCNLRSLCICLSEVIFLEGFMRRIYSCLSSLQVLHLIGTFEMTSEGDEDVYEVVNIGKIKAHTPNLRVVNMYGITFIDDSHIELLTSNCIHLECLALNYCLRVKGSSFKTLIQRCKKLKTLLLTHTGVENENMVNVPWETAQVHELDLTSTELSTECLENVLYRIPFFTYLGLGHCEFFTDKIMDGMVQRGKFKQLRAIDISSTPALSENTIYQFLQLHGRRLQGLVLSGKPPLTENFWLNVINFLPNIRVCVLGTANGWFLKLTTKVHIDQVIEGFAQNCPYLMRLEIQWDPDTIRFSDKSNKFVDHIRLRCPHLKSFTLSDGEYYEMVKSNFERADRMKVVRTTTNYSTSISSLGKKKRKKKRKKKNEKTPDMSVSPPGSPRRQSEISSFRGAVPKRNPRGRSKRAKSPDRTLPFFEKSQFDDVEIVCGEKRIHTNSCLLSYSSPVFAKTLSNDNVGKGKTKTVTNKDIDLSEQKFDDVCQLMKWIDPRITYELEDEHAIRLLPMAEEYDIQPLKKSCASTITQSFHKKRRGRRAGCIPTDETIRHLVLADKYQLNDLQEMCCEELVANDNPFSCKAVSDSKELSEHAKVLVLEKKVDKLNMAVARARRFNTEKEQPKDTRGSTIWKK